jgi:hypothetical protein
MKSWNSKVEPLMVIEGLHARGSTWLRMRWSIRNELLSNAKPKPMKKEFWVVGTESRVRT